MRPHGLLRNETFSRGKKFVLVRASNQGPRPFRGGHAANWTNQAASEWQQKGRLIDNSTLIVTPSCGIPQNLFAEGYWVLSSVEWCVANFFLHCASCAHSLASEEVMYSWLSEFIPHTLWACTYPFNAMDILWVVSQWDKVEVLSLDLFFHSWDHGTRYAFLKSDWHSVGHRGGLKWQAYDWPVLLFNMDDEPKPCVLFFACEAKPSVMVG